AIGLNVSGISAGTLVLQNNAGDNLTITADGNFTFAAQLTSGSAYDVTVLSEPANHICSVSSGSGIVGVINIDNIVVTCIASYTIGGNVTLTGGAFAVKNTVSGEILNISGAGIYQFTQPVTEGGAYNIIIETAPAAEVCSFSGDASSGLNVMADVTNLNISCTSVGAWNLGGGISQSGGGSNGAIVFVRLYTSPTEILNHVAETEVSVTGGSPAVSSYSFTVADGTYYVRAFRDENGDSEPSFNSDAQSGIIGPIVISGANSSANNIDLNVSVNTDEYTGFNVYTYHETAQPEAPWDDLAQKEGAGFCGGYYLRFEASKTGTSLDPAAPAVRLPDGSEVSLLDDGGCGSNVADNTALSYDYGATDNSFSYGIDSPGSLRVGNYTLYFRNTASEHIHIEVDNIASINKLARVRSVSPDGAAAQTTLTPTISWTMAAGSLSNTLYLFEMPNYTFHTGTDTTSASYSIPAATPLSDLKAYKINIISYDADISAGWVDFDAKSESLEHAFITDTTGTNHIVVSGTLTNRTNISADYFLQGINADQGYTLESTIITQGPDYSLVFLHTPSICNGGVDECGIINAFLDADGSGDKNGVNNQDYKKFEEKLDISTGITLSGIDFEWNPRVLLNAPSDDAALLSTAPAFSWQDYSADAPASGTWSYALFITDLDTGSGGMPDIIWGLPNTTTSFDMSAALSGKDQYDIVCLANGGAWDGTTCTGAAGQNILTLLPATNYRWGVAIIECEYNDFVTDNSAAAPADNYSQCLMPLLSGSGLYAQSEERDFITP
ncbi:MAG: hypothetical protein OEZ13_10960, partial [Spirochaetia bacterium]|nr:hypothetical protein [Spirochaetia bacterium]